MLNAIVQSSTVNALVAVSKVYCIFDGESEVQVEFASPAITAKVAQTSVIANLSTTVIHAHLAESVALGGTQFAPADVSDWDGVYSYFGTENGTDYDIRRVALDGNAEHAIGAWTDRLILGYV